jgi:hypothetical protein
MLRLAIVIAASVLVVAIAVVAGPTPVGKWLDEQA